MKDLGKSSQFYRQVLQLDTIPNPFNDAIHLWLNIGGGASLHLIEGTRIPAGSMVLGSPAKVVRELTDEEIANMHRGIRSYVTRAATFRKDLKKIG